ncbi:MAG TPA: pyrroline-5-carboxylate reductase [Candidatus Anaerobutyricum stercoripullorum]|uniref:Pyrroline-5-carboxylate reductase n=1 Tax=Candidatus Anaerobutyricum stercoripullorum TaxID=2838456 RepID=A0A9D1X5L0_9FIRM|nr:pyrroline-5-carboxylate reductase [Candidatus Anaerobutyricum stercoripullorum]
MKTLGFIGMGNMAKAIAEGIIKSGKMSGQDVYAYAPHQDKLQKNAKAIGFMPCATMEELLEASDTVVMACKPYQIEGVLEMYRDALAGKALVSIAAGWDFAKYKPLLDASTRVQFIMPNTPAMVGEGVMLFEETHSLEEEERKELFDLFSALGLVEEIPSHLMGIAGTLTGCGPAFIDLVIEALGDAGVKYGVPRAQAYALVSQMILGSAKLQLKTGEHPGVLKDNVCSPAGTTIRGVNALERAGLRAAFLDAIDAIVG